MGCGILSDTATLIEAARRTADGVLGGPSLHPLLDFDPVGRLRYDLRQPITQIQARMPQYVKLQQLATNPVVCRMTIHIPATSWVLTLQNPQGVTVEHVLTMLYNELQRIVGRGEYLSFPLATQHHASAVYHARSRGNHAEHSQGIKRVDFLCGKCLFLGLTRATDGSDAMRAMCEMDRWTVYRGTGGQRQGDIRERIKRDFTNNDIFSETHEDLCIGVPNSQGWSLMIVEISYELLQTPTLRSSCMGYASNTKVLSAWFPNRNPSAVKIRSVLLPRSRVSAALSTGDIRQDFQPEIPRTDPNVIGGINEEIATGATDKNQQEFNVGNEIVQDWFDCEALTEPGNREYQTWAVTGSLSASEHPLAMVFGPTTDLYVK
ncbi:hypothetical protein L208DRAFT_1458009 [Tricholoma matsutake]|nr:hypothetical protein L208DRAFT_1458009 [Tricholoma matsutake 945]